MFRLPLENTRAFDLMGDVAHVVEVLAPSNLGRMLDLQGAIRAGRKTLADCASAKSVALVCMRSDDDRLLIEVTRRAWRKIHNFSRDARGRRL